MKKDSEFVWTTEHDRAFAEVKLTVSEDCLIQFYDPQKPLYIECDASKQGIGCVFLQPDDNIPSTLKDGIPTNLRPVATHTHTQQTHTYPFIQPHASHLGVNKTLM